MIVMSTTSLMAALRVAVLAPALSFAAPAHVAAQNRSVQNSAASVAGPVYERRDACIEAGLLTAEQCEFAYRNARAEFEQKAPRYASRAQCERSHKRCGAQMISTGGWDAFGKGGAATYVPRFAGVRVTGEGPGRLALPFVKGGGRIAFVGRPVGELQDKVTGRTALIWLASTRGHGRSHDPQSSGPYVKRGDRDDTVPVPMERKRIGADVAPGLYVDPEGVEWYKPSHRR